MDFLFYCSGECDDALRDREFYLIKNARHTDEARTKLASALLSTYEPGEATEAEAAKWANEDWDVMVCGEDLHDPHAHPEANYSYKLYELE